MEFPCVSSHTTVSVLFPLSLYPSIIRHPPRLYM